MTEWQPIETAPKDGVYILALCRANPLSPRRYEFARMGARGWIRQDGRAVPYEPTHWMPLPEPPQ